MPILSLLDEDIMGNIDDSINHCDSNFAYCRIAQSMTIEWKFPSSVVRLSELTVPHFLLLRADDLKLFPSSPRASAFHFDFGVFCAGEIGGDLLNVLQFDDSLGSQFRLGDKLDDEQ